MKATFNGTVIAESNETIVIENNHYFPPASVKTEYLTPSDKTYECPWKGHAIYYNVVVGDKTDENAAWCYPSPKEAAKQIAGYIAFWQGVEIAEA